MLALASPEIEILAFVITFGMLLLSQFQYTAVHAAMGITGNTEPNPAASVHIEP